MARAWRCRAAALVALAVFANPVGPAHAQERVVAFEIINGRAIPAPLTETPGDPEAGRQLYFDRDLTGCSGCHGSPGGPGAEAKAGQEGAPALARLAARMDAGTARLWLVAPEVLRPGTAMPGFYTIGQRTDANDPRFGEPILSAQEIEDILAYLLRKDGQF